MPTDTQDTSVASPQSLDQIFGKQGTPQGTQQPLDTGVKTSLDSIFGAPKTSNHTTSQPDVTSKLDSIFKPTQSNTSNAPEKPADSLNAMNIFDPNRKTESFGSLWDKWTQHTNEAGQNVANNLKSNWDNLVATNKQFNAPGGNTGKQLAATTSHSAGDIAGMILAPFGGVLDALGLSKPISDAIQGTANGVNAIPHVTDVLNKLNDIFDKHPDVKQSLLTDIPNVLQALTLSLSPKAKGGVPSLSETAGNLKTDIGASADVAKEAVGAFGEGAKETASSIKEKISPTKTIDGLVGQVAQGKTGDIPSFTEGLKNIDTSNVKTYQDLNNVSAKSISDEAKLQDSTLSKDAGLHKLADLEQTTGTGTSAVKTNYVQDALTQLKEFYTKTSDAQGLVKVNQWLEKATGDGLSVKDMNDIARTHGSDLNAYNANGELATGLTKQAAENTRIGLKDTIKSSISDPAIRDQFSASDSKMSDSYTVKDLSQKMAEKVNTLTQRLQKPNILQKIGSLFGKATRITGVGDFAQKLLGIDKVPGATTLNPVELEAKLSKNLARIEKALSRNDAGFVKDITSIVNDETK